MMKIKNSQTDFIGLLFVLVVIFGIAIFSFILYDAYSNNIKPNLEESLTASTPVDASANVSKILSDTESGIGNFNPLFPLVLVGLLGFVVMSAFIAKSHPAFLFIGLLVVGIIILLASVYSNVFETISSTDTYSDTAEEFDIITFMMENLALIITIFFVVVAVVLYALPNASGGGGY